MEVGNQTINTFHFIGGIEENFRVSAFFFYKTIVVCYAFKGTDGSCTYRNYSPTITLRSVDDLRRLRADRIVLGVHFMVSNDVFTDGAERSQPYVQ